MFANDEMAAVDDWRFSSRVATRSDAVRKLAQIGMASYRDIDAVLAATGAAAARIDAFNRALAEVAVDGLGDPGYSAAVRAHFDELRRLVMKANRQAIALAETLVFIQETPDLDGAIGESRSSQEAAEASSEALAVARREEGGDR